MGTYIDFRGQSVPLELSAREPRRNILYWKYVNISRRGKKSYERTNREEVHYHSAHTCNFGGSFERSLSISNVDVIRRSDSMTISNFHDSPDCKTDLESSPYYNRMHPTRTVVNEL
jgi:hypothetical protein